VTVGPSDHPADRSAVDGSARPRYTYEHNGAIWIRNTAKARDWAFDD
jgi:hypothetical protein